MKRVFLIIVSFVFMGLALSCEILDNDPDKHVSSKKDSTYVGLEEVAEILASLPLEFIHLHEVHDAVASSSGNGYDEEYTMKHLFGTPGMGVGDKRTKNGDIYPEPLRSLIEDYVQSGCMTKSGDGTIKDADEFLEALERSDIQIYWPFSENWDGSSMPVITFDPEDGSEVNVGYRLNISDDGFRHVEEVLVDEAMAERMPVWVVNRNSDAGFTSLELLRREDSEWGEGGGNIIVRPAGYPGKEPFHGTESSETKASRTTKCLVLKDFMMKRNYDSWFAGASEFFVKTGYLEDFTASTEAELKLYSPMVTDFMIVVKRREVGKPQELNAVLMTDWSENSDACAFMITEDDGGTRETWSAKTKVYVSGKSYGFEISLPFNRRDDIVWRGSLSYSWINRCKGEQWPFGDVMLTFELMEY